MLVGEVVYCGAAKNTVLVQGSSCPHIKVADPELDLEILAENLGQEQRAYFADRLSRQKRGDGVLLTAWLGDRLIGDAYLWLEDAEEPELRMNLPGVPLLTHVEIKKEFRSQGIGTLLINTAEKTLIERRHARVALAVETSNERARKLYERLGYRDWGNRSVPYIHCYDPFDGGVESPEKCHVMVKDLR